MIGKMGFLGLIRKCIVRNIEDDCDKELFFSQIYAHAKGEDYA